MATILEAKAIISGEDRTGTAFGSVEKKMARLEKAAGQMAKASGAIGSLSSVVASRRMIDGLSNFDEKFASQSMISRLSQFTRQANSAAEAVEKVATSMANAGQMIRAFDPRRLKNISSGVMERFGQMAPIVEGIAGAGALHATREAIVAGADLELQRARMTAGGIPAAEISRAEDQSYSLSARYTNISPTEGMETYKELRSVLLKPSETPAMLPTVIATKSAMKGLGMGDDIDSLQFAVKGAEILGRAQNQERFRSYLDHFIRAQQVMGKLVTPEQMFEFAKYSKASGATLSDRFLTHTAFSLSAEIGGSTAGQSVDQFVKQIVGGFQGQQHAAAKEFIHMGLANKDDFEEARTGEIKGLKPGRHIPGWQLAATDPDKYVAQYVVPALQAHGLTSLTDQISEVRRLFPTGRAADLVTKLIQQRDSYANHAAQIDSAAGIDGGLKLAADSATASLTSLTTSLQSFGATLTSPIMLDAAHAMSGISKWIADLSARLHGFDKAHSFIAEGAGGAAIIGGLGGGIMGAYSLYSGLSSGFGLKESAALLAESAAALDTSAAKIGAGSVAGAAAGAGAEGPAASAAAGVTSTLVASAVRIAWPIALALMPDSVDESKKAYEKTEKEHPEINKKLPDLSGDDLGKGAIVHLFDELSAAIKHIHDATWGPGAKRGQRGEGPGSPVQAELKGAADVNVHVEVSADKDTVVKSVLSQLKSDSSLLRVNNTGKSMPEASPNRTGRQK